MLISETIAKLEALKEKYGDLPVFLDNKYNESVDCFLCEDFKILEEIENHYHIGGGDLKGKVVLITDT